MSENPEQDLNLRRQSPEVSIEMGEVQLIMNWGNTLLRFFDEGEGSFDHVAHKQQDGTYVAFRPTEELKDQLIDGGFPRRYDTIVDEPTIQWCMQVLEKTLPNLSDQ